MNHKPRDKKKAGVWMRQCKRCKILWDKYAEEHVMSTKCPGRKK